MGFMSGEERALGAALSRLGYANPFLPERIEAEGAALGPAFVHADRVWSVHTDRTVQNPNVARLAERATTLAALLRERDRKSTRLNSSHRCISYAVFCLKK